MEFVIGIFILVVIAFVARSGKSPGGSQWLPPSAPLNSSRSAHSAEPWRSDPATEKQIKYIEELGGRVPKGRLTKGEASEIIDSLLPPDEEDLKVLRFFKVSTKGLNENSASEAVERLLGDPANLEKWNARPPDAETREFFRFIGEKLPAGIVYAEAQSLMRNKMVQMGREKDPRRDDWIAYSTILEDLNDADFREGYDIKKPSITLIRTVTATLVKEGWTYDRMRSDEDEFIERLIEVDPKLEKE